MRTVAVTITILALALFALYLMQSAEQSEKPANYERKQVSFLRCVSSENCMYALDSNEIARLKSMNVNAIRICPLYEARPDGSMFLIESKPFYINMIRNAHNAGFAVLLEPNAFLPYSQPPGEKHLNSLFGIASEWADVAESEGVEIFSPLNEPDAVLRGSALEEWINMTSKLRNAFSGKLMLKLGGTGPGGITIPDGYDYLAFDIMFEREDPAEAADYAMLAAQKGNYLKERYNLSGFVFGEVGALASLPESGQAGVFEAVLNETWENVDGYCFLGWSDMEFGFRGRKGEEVVREWFSRER